MSLSLITRKFTVEEYEKMATEGIIKPDEKVELIRGEIIKMSPMGTRHAAGIARLTGSSVCLMQWTGVIRDRTLI
jgi:Uma2 family endonuclease